MANRERRARKPSRGALAAGILTCLVLLASCKAAGVLPSMSSNSDDADAKAILRALGVTAVDNPPDLTTTSTQGTAVTIDDPDAWQPLKTTYAVFEPKAEVAIFGIASEYHTTYYNSIFGLTVNYSENNLITDDQAWEKTAVKAACAADVDGDGLDEFVVIYVVSGSFYLRVYDYGTGKYSSALKVGDITPSSAITTTSAYNLYVSEIGGYIPYLDLRPADVDGDGSDELLLADYATVYVLETDNTASDLSVLESKTFTGAVTSLASGDTDGDGADEFVVCVNTVGFGYYDSSLDDPLSNPEIISVSSTGVVEACMGDFDGDSVDELAITSFYLQNAAMSIYVYETTVDNGALTLEQTITGITPISASLCGADPHAVDLDGNGGDDLYVGGYVVMDPLDGGDTTYSLSSFIGYLLQVGVGDVDGDGKQDLVLVGSPGTIIAYNTALSVGLNSSGSLAVKYTYITSCAVPLDSTSAYTQGSGGFGASRALAVGNVDKDSARVKYTGHELTFTDPAVVAVLVSPPYWSAVADADEAYAGSYTNWETTYGTVTSESSSSGTELTASVGCTVKFEQEGGVFGIKIANFETELTVKGYCNYEINWSKTISKSVTYTAVGGEDKVLFLCAPIDVYSYEVLESPDSDDVGKTLTLEIPRDYNIYSVTRSYFNANNGAVNDIDASVLSHTYGNPSSYPSKSEMQSLYSTYGGYKSTSALPAAQGGNNTASGVTNLEISVESGKEETTSVGVEVDYSIGGGAGGWAVLADLGFSVGYTSTISTSTGTTFGGTVGYLPTMYYENSAYNYSSGLFAYSYDDSRDGRTYWIVDYWVE